MIIYFSGNECNEAWRYCAEQLVAAGCSDLYSKKYTHITDRDKGLLSFEAFLELAEPLLQRPMSVNCAGHILGNARTSQNVAKTERNFHNNQFWAIQGSKSTEELAANLTAMQAQFPSVVEYLMNIKPELWIWY
jgi:hypothetical protein